MSIAKKIDTLKYSLVMTDGKNGSKERNLYRKFCFIYLDVCLLIFFNLSKCTLIVVVPNLKYKFYHIYSLFKTFLKFHLGAYTSTLLKDNFSPDTSHLQISIKMIKNQIQMVHKFIHWTFFSRKILPLVWEIKRTKMELDSWVL